MLLASAPANVITIPPVVATISPVAETREEVARPPEAPAVTVPDIAEPGIVTSHSGAIEDHAALAQGEIVVTGKSLHTPGDPLEGINAKSFALTQDIDRAIVKPMAMTYRSLLPNPVRDGIRNLINNLREPVAFLNFLLQLKPGKAAETAGRFTINSTIGVAGLVDFAKRKPFKLPRRPNGFANTLGYYGVKSGPFLFLPIVGPTTLRDFIGDGIDRLVLPVAIGKPFNQPVYGIPIYVFSSLDQRAEFDEKLEEMHKDSDPYARTREDYLRSRQAAIDALHGKPAADGRDMRARP